ncbi:MAG: hypothetical protein GY884_10975 [Proteobacteria bacterium]|nr:hypothetical protein [Pseudomonadota bacterium]
MIWLSLLLGTTYLDRPDGEEWVWFAHVYEPKSPDCWGAALQVTTELTGNATRSCRSSPSSSRCLAHGDVVYALMPKGERLGG